MDRREFIEKAAAAATLPLVPALFPAEAAAAEAGAGRLIVVMLRGAADGLNMVVPYGDQAYYDVRPTIAIAKPGAENGALSLDEHFALHPALAPLLPLWNDKKLAVIHAAGSPDPTRSHFDAQQFIENGTPGRATTADGWMNRALAALPGARTPTDALSVGAVLPYILKGPVPVANLPLGPNAGQQMSVDNPAVASAFDKLYAGNDRQGEAYRQGREARSQLVADMASEEQKMADNGAPPAAGFPAIAGRLARLIVQDRHIRLAFVSLGRWDTHVHQGSHAGQLAERLRPLGLGLAGLASGLGQGWNDTIVVVISEFGRTVRENGNAGTDHGHGNAMFVMGGPVNGGKIYGEWPGLAPAQLYEGRDLAVTTDFRHPLAAILERHLRLDDKAVEKIFPGMPTARGNLAAQLIG